MTPTTELMKDINAIFKQEGEKQSKRCENLGDAINLRFKDLYREQFHCAGKFG